MNENALVVPATLQASDSIGWFTVEDDGTQLEVELTNDPGLRRQ